MYQKYKYRICVVLKIYCKPAVSCKLCKQHSSLATLSAFITDLKEDFILLLWVLFVNAVLDISPIKNTTLFIGRPLVRIGRRAASAMNAYGYSFVMNRRQKCIQWYPSHQMPKENILSSKWRTISLLLQTAVGISH